MNPFKVVTNWWKQFWDNRSWMPIGSLRKTASSETVSEETALNYSAVWCATRLLSGTMAGLPLPVFDGLDTEQRTKRRDHPVFRVMNHWPNKEQTALNFRSVMWQWTINWGNCYAEIEREGNDPEGELKSLWPLHPSRVAAMRDEDDALYYSVRNKPGEPDSELEPWQMFHVPSIITYDGITGLGIIQHARESIGAGIAQEKYAANWFGSGAVPRVVIKGIPPKWDAEAREGFRKEWDEIYGDGPTAKRVATLPMGMDVTPLNISAEDSQFLETRNFSVTEIARWYGIPPHLLQHLLDAHFNNVEQLGIAFVQYSLIPWLRIWEQCVAQKLLTPDERGRYFAEHNVDALMRGDSAARAAYYQTLVNAGIMSRNQARKLENWDAVDGGDTFLVQGAMVPLDDGGKPQSDFAGNAATEPPVTQPPDGMSAVAGKVRGVLRGHLSRILTKESKRMLAYAQKPGRFLHSVDEFYSSHLEFVTAAVSDTMEALAGCGVLCEVAAFVAEWAEAGRRLIVDAADVKPGELAASVQRCVESEAWTQRPVLAVERIVEQQAVAA